jgi:hypothetical protein
VHSEARAPHAAAEPFAAVLQGHQRGQDAQDLQRGEVTDGTRCACLVDWSGEQDDPTWPAAWKSVTASHHVRAASVLHSSDVARYVHTVSFDLFTFMRTYAS